MRIIGIAGILYGFGMIFSTTGCQKEERRGDYEPYLDAKCTCMPEPPSYTIPVKFKDYEGKTVSLEYKIAWARSGWNGDKYELHPLQICEIKVFTPEQTIHHYSFSEPESYDGVWSVYCEVQDKRFNYSTAIPIKFHYIEVVTPMQSGIIDYGYVQEYLHYRDKRCPKHRERDDG